MQTTVINEQIQEMLNKLDETGEFSQYRLKKLSKDPEALFKACLEWDGIIGFEEDIKNYARGLFKALPILLYEREENPFRQLNEREEEIRFLCNLLDRRQLEEFNNFLKENGRDFTIEAEEDLIPVEE